jgi:hypothetical protein
MISSSYSIPAHGSAQWKIGVIHYVENVFLLIYEL